MAKTQAERNKEDEERARRLSLPAPQWHNTTAITQRVADEIAEAELEEERLWWTHYLPNIQKAYAAGGIPPARLPRDWRKPSTPAPKPSAQEIAAIRALKKRGDVEPLADLIRPSLSLDGGSPYAVSPAVERGLSLATWHVLTQLVTGEINPRKLRGPGRRKMTDEERRAINPVHDATDMVPEIELIIARLYPAKTKANVRKRAIEVAASLRGAQQEPLKRHLRRGKGDKRRLG